MTSNYQGKEERPPDKSPASPTKTAQNYRQNPQPHKPERQSQPTDTSHPNKPSMDMLTLTAAVALPSPHLYHANNHVYCYFRSPTQISVPRDNNSILKLTVNDQRHAN